MNSKPNCDVRNRAYKNGKTFEDCKHEARKLSTTLTETIQKNGMVSWDNILDIADHDEIVYKLTLKYLRESGHDIGDYTKPRVIRPNNSDQQYNVKHTSNNI